MPDNQNALSNTLEVFSATIEELIAALGKGISDAQRALDLNSIQTQKDIDSNPVASQYGLQATWYQFPRVDLQLKLAVTVTQDQSSPAPLLSSGLRAVPAGLIATQLKPIRLVAQPVSASYATHFSYDAQAASTLSLSIVPVPARTPPQVAQALDLGTVQALALASPAKFVTTKDAQGNAIPADKDGQGNALRFDMSFNAMAGLWYVLQYAPSNPGVKPVVVAVDDSTKSVRVISSP